MGRSIDRNRRPCLPVVLLLWAALCAISRVSIADEAAGANVAPGKLPDGIFTWVDDETHSRWYAPERWLCDRSTFRVYPMLAVDEDGGRRLTIHAVVLTQAKKGIRLLGVDVGVDGVDTSLPLDRDAVGIDGSSCLTAEHATIEEQDDLIRSIGEARQVVVTFRGGRDTLDYRLTEADRETFRKFAALARLETLPVPQETAKKPPAIEGAAPGESQGVVDPKIIRKSKVKPEYPRIARKRRRKGRVVLQVVAETDGSVDRLKVLQSTTCDCGFEDAAAEAVKQWRYVPGRLNGEPVPVSFTVVVDFVLD